MERRNSLGHSTNPKSSKHQKLVASICWRIMEANLPHGCNKLIIDLYDKLSDLDEHVDTLVTQMNLFMNDDAVMCWVFPTTLKGATLHWYTRLPQNSVDSFVALITYFGAQYATRISHHLTTVALTNVWQDEDESLHNFMERPLGHSHFNDHGLEVMALFG